MLVINGLKFAKNDKEFTDTLFNKDGTAFGFYKKYKRGCIHLMDMQGELFAAIICNKHDFKGIVNAVKLEGRNHYQYGASEKTKKLLGVPNGYIAEREYAQELFNSVK